VSRCLKASDQASFHSLIRFAHLTEPSIYANDRCHGNEVDGSFFLLVLNAWQDTPKTVLIKILDDLDIVYSTHELSIYRGTIVGKVDLLCRYIDDIKLEHIPGVINTANAQTKSLGCVLHHQHVRRIMDHYGPCTI
jgi:hypothetical protein